MSSDNQFTALGASGPPTNAGFFTDANNITFGVNVQGIDTTGVGCGVYAEAIAASPGLRSNQSGSHPGVWGVGDHYGVYGASKDLYTAGPPPTDRTPLLNPGLRTPPVPVTGSVGVAGASRFVPGVIGTSDVVEPATAFLNGPNSLIGNSVGAMGISATSFGVVGANVSTNTLVPLPVKVLFRPPVPESSAGVFGWSLHGRGGVFASGTPVVEGAPPFPPTNLSFAQVRLVPDAVSLADVETVPPPKQPTPALPRSGLAGDLIAVDVAPQQGGSATQLWFCIRSGFVGGAAATWAQIAFGETIQGQY
jgi:hypothetical protein